MQTDVVKLPQIPLRTLSGLVLAGILGLIGCAESTRTTTETRTGPGELSAASKQAPSVTTIIVPIHADRQVASVREAQLSHKHPERLSLFTPTTPFDATAYSAHPESYLDVIEPGRALAPAEAGPDVPLLKMLGTPRPTVASLGTVAITVQGMAQAPITFTSLDRGLFQNGLTSITLQADSHGLGTAEFTATAGTVAEVRVVAASPLASGQGHWVILIQAVTHG